MENKPKHAISLEVVLFLVLALASTIFYKYCFFTKKRKHPLPPGPIGLPIVGCIPQMLRNKPTFRWMLKLMQEMNTEIACIRLGATNVIPVTSPELAREFLKKQDAIFSSRPDCMSGRVTSNGYLSAAISPAGDQWKKMKRVIITEVLSPAMHRWLHDKRCEESDCLVQYVYEQCRNPLTNGLVNVRLIGRHHIGNVIRRLMFNRRFFGVGMEDGGPGIEEIEHVEGSYTILTYLYWFAIADYLPWLQALDLDGHKKVLCDGLKLVRKHQDPEIEKRAEMWEQGSRKTQEDILDVLINLKDSRNNPLLSIEEIKTQIIEMTLAIIDNPPNAIEWCIAEMINQPHILEKAHKELDRVVGRDRLVNESDLCNLNYVKACVKEALRLHPATPFSLPHVSIEDTTVGGYFIPKGSHVLLSRPGLGRNPRAWEEPLKYKPERHIIDETTNVVLIDPEVRMFSFGTGRRGCPGNILGSTIMTMLLARLIQAFNWSAPAPPDKPNIDLAESRNNLLMANPLIARANPRMEADVYMQLLTEILLKEG